MSRLCSYTNFIQNIPDIFTNDIQISANQIWGFQLDTVNWSHYILLMIMITKDDMNYIEKADKRNGSYRQY